MNTLPSARLDHVVANLDVAAVSWSANYCDAAREHGLKIRTSDQSAATAMNRLFIGDELTPDMVAEAAVNLYFLAAADCSAAEAYNIAATDLTTTVSLAERLRIEQAFPKLAGRIAVTGFPINIPALDRVAQTTQRQPGSVCFVGRTDADKGPDEELNLAKQLIADGLRVEHLSGGDVTIADELRDSGVTVHPHLRGNAYYQLLAQQGCVVNTSPRESLFVSGLEASRLGVPVIVPDQLDSGTADWSISRNRYTSGDLEQAAWLASIQSRTDQPAVADVSRYDMHRYFQAIDQLVAEAWRQKL